MGRGIVGNNSAHEGVRGPLFGWTCGSREGGGARDFGFDFLIFLSKTLSLSLSVNYTNTTINTVNLFIYLLME